MLLRSWDCGGGVGFASADDTDDARGVALPDNAALCGSVMGRCILQLGQCEDSFVGGRLLPVDCEVRMELVDLSSVYWCPLHMCIIATS